MPKTTSARNAARHNRSFSSQFSGAGPRREAWELPALVIDEASGALIVLEPDDIVRVTASTRNASSAGFRVH